VIGPSGIAPLAQRQLAAWQALAADWPVHATDEDGQIKLACGECGRGIVPLRNTTGDYHYVLRHFTDATVMHLRQRHAEVEPAGL
jgi:hypothetical protein